MRIKHRTTYENKMYYEYSPSIATHNNFFVYCYCWYDFQMFFKCLQIQKHKKLIYHLLKSHIALNDRKKCNNYTFVYNVKLAQQFF